jgi:hypothetical protein
MSSVLFVRKSEKTVKLSTTKRKNDQKRHLNAPRKLDELPSAELSKQQKRQMSARRSANRVSALT